MITNVLKAMRPRQWGKNIFIFVALVFSKNVFNVEMFLTALSAFFIFCFLSGGIYIFNDIIDKEKDRLHPLKSKRPIASGELSENNAYIFMFFLIIISILASFFININFAYISILYILIQVFYSISLKNVVILDIFCVSSGFFLRVIAGALAIIVPVSSWLLICTFFVSVFITLAKRRHEILILEETAGEHRKVLRDYNTLLLDQMISVVTSSTVVSYAVYTLSEETIAKMHTTNLKYTIPFLLFGIYRYLYIVYLKKEGGSPESIFFKDLPFQINMILYVVSVILILYT